MAHEGWFADPGLHRSGLKSNPHPLIPGASRHFHTHTTRGQACSTRVPLAANWVFLNLLGAGRVLSSTPERLVLGPPFHPILRGQEELCSSKRRALKHLVSACFDSGGPLMAVTGCAGILKEERVQGGFVTKSKSRERCSNLSRAGPGPCLSQPMFMQCGELGRASSLGPFGTLGSLARLSWRRRVVVCRRKHCTAGTALLPVLTPPPSCPPPVL